MYFLYNFSLKTKKDGKKHRKHDKISTKYLTPVKTYDIMLVHIDNTSTKTGGICEKNKFLQKALFSCGLR